MIAAAKEMLKNYAPTEIVFGECALPRLEQEIRNSGAKCVLFVRGGNHSFVESGMSAALAALQMPTGVTMPCFHAVPPEPDTEVVRAIVSWMKEAQPDLVVAVGGGSVLDAAKAAYLSWQSGMDVVELFGACVASAKFPDRKFKRVICIPTTSGTGSEITPYSNIVDVERELKFIIVDQQIIPELALIDPRFTESMSPALTATTALDAMTHSIESLLNYRAKDADPAAEDWALTSVQLIKTALPKVYGPEEREMLSIAAALGGMCIACRPTALPHLCSYSMWGKVSHGLAVSLLLPHFWRYYLGGATEISEQTMKLSGIFGGTTPEEVIASCETFIAEVSPYKKLSEIDGFDIKMVETIASDAVRNPVKLQTAPRPVALDEANTLIREILMRAL